MAFHLQMGSSVAQDIPGDARVPACPYDPSSSYSLFEKMKLKREKKKKNEDFSFLRALTLAGSSFWNVLPTDV